MRSSDYWGVFEEVPILEDPIVGPSGIPNLIGALDIMLGMVIRHGPGDYTGEIDGVLATGASPITIGSQRLQTGTL